MSDITDVMARDIEEAERRARAEARNNRNYAAEMDSRVDCACCIICIVLAILAGAFVAWLHYTQPARERAAFLSGFNGPMLAEVCHGE